MQDDGFPGPVSTGNKTCSSTVVRSPRPFGVQTTSTWRLILIKKTVAAHPPRSCTSTSEGKRDPREDAKPPDNRKPAPVMFVGGLQMVVCHWFECKSTVRNRGQANISFVARRLRRGFVLCEGPSHSCGESDKDLGKQACHDTHTHWEHVTSMVMKKTGICSARHTRHSHATHATHTEHPVHGQAHSQTEPQHNDKTIIKQTSPQQST